MGTELKTLHDRLLSEQPNGAVHDSKSCPLCDMEDPTVNPEGGDVASFTQEQVDAAVAKATSEAVGPLTQQIEHLQASAKETEVGKAIAEALAPKETEISDLQSRLDAAEAKATKAETDLTTLQASVEAEKKEAQERETREARKAERVQRVKDAKVLSDQYVEDNADRFAAMNEEDFVARLDEWKNISSAGKEGEKIPDKTGFQASREEAKIGSLPAGSMLGELGSFRGTLSDPRTI